MKLLINMKPNFVFHACLAAASGLGILSASVAYAGNGVPDYIVEHKGQPAIAVFEDVKQSYALGCPGFRSLWKKVAVQRAVSSAVFRVFQEINDPGIRQSYQIFQQTISSSLVNVEFVFQLPPSLIRLI